MTTAESQKVESGCLMGRLETWSLQDIFVWLHQSGKNAMVRVGTGLDAGVVFFQEGHLYRAEHGRQQGPDAVYNLLGQHEGPVTIIQRDLPKPHPNVRTPTPELLLTCAVARDEATRSRNCA